MKWIRALKWAIRAWLGVCPGCGCEPQKSDPKDRRGISWCAGCFLEIEVKL